MAENNGQPGDSWTAGPAKWAAVILLGGTSIGGLVWSARGRVANPLLHPRAVEAAPAPSAGSGPPEPVRPAESAKESAAPLRTINLNTASAAELELLPGIGPALAARIVDERAAHGQFRSVNDLDRVKGIGPKTIQKLRPLVRIE